MQSTKLNNDRTPGDKRVSFHVRLGSLTRWVNARTMVDQWGFYQDAQYLYTDQGKWERKNLVGSPIESNNPPEEGAEKAI
jgi:hypothetical protein